MWVRVGQRQPRSWTWDSELTVAVVDASPRRAARELRLSLSEEHLGAAATGRDLDDPVAWFEAFRDAAGALDAWHEGVACGPRPPGRLRKYRQPVLPAPRAWASALYGAIYDPDGRGVGQRLRGWRP